MVCWCHSPKHEKKRGGGPTLPLRRNNSTVLPNGSNDCLPPIDVSLTQLWAALHSLSQGNSCLCIPQLCHILSDLVKRGWTLVSGVNCHSLLSVWQLPSQRVCNAQLLKAPISESPLLIYKAAICCVDSAHLGWRLRTELFRVPAAGQRSVSLTDP